jgi:hypothetical protein
MKFGNFLFPDCRDPERDGVVIDETLREARLADELGVDVIWLAEHHFDGICAYVDPITFAGALATATRHAKIGFAVVQTALHHPIRLAEQLAILDNITKGRLVVGLGRGSSYNIYDYQGFGIDHKEAQARLEEAEEILATEDWLDPHFAFYDRITDSIQAGIDSFERSSPTERGAISWVFFRNLKVTSARIEHIDKRRPPAFADHRPYLCCFTENYANIYYKIRVPDRCHHLDIVSTQSRGYDTAAVNTIASKHKMDNVFTIAEVKESEPSSGPRPSLGIDEGSDICEVLGLKAMPLDRGIHALGQHR